MSMWDTFPSVSKEQWLEKITADLKGKSPNDFFVNGGSGQLIEPWYHKDDTKHAISIPGRTLDRTLLGRYISVEDAGEANKAALASLEGGSSYLHFKINKSIELNQLLAGIHLEMITSVWDVDDTEPFELSPVLSDAKDDIHLYPESHGIIDLKEKSDLVEAFLSAEDMIIKSDMTSRITCQIPFGHAYIENITTVLAIRLLHANLCEAYNIDKNELPLIIEGHIKPEVRSDEIHQDLISITQIMTAMFSADVDVICPLADEDSAENQRLIRQVFHVLTMEGHLGKVKAPYAGSYALEKIAFDMAEKCWTNYVSDL